jgi:DNA-binding FadR family transcriptional regulator
LAADNLYSGGNIMSQSAKQEDILPLKREKISEKVVAVIQNYIVRNNLKRGHRLPSERVLSETLNVGTRSIREALKNLEARGIVRIEQGKGAFVEEKYRDDFVRFLADSLELTLTRDQNLIVELMYVRKII